MAEDLLDGRGVLYPARLPTFHRELAAPALADRVRWFWVPRWRLAPGRTSRQHLLAFPASNLVVGPEAVMLSGPTTRASHVDLQGQGWVVGALLRPAALARLHPQPGRIRDAEVAHQAPELHRGVAAAMSADEESAGRQRAVELFATWVQEHLAPPDEDGLMANALEEIVSGDRSLVRVDQLARRLGVSVRTVQRLSQRCIGLPPLALIRRYRLQEAAQRLRQEPDTTVAQIAAELGYADHAHLSTDFRTTLGLTPRDYRAAPRSSPDSSRGDAVK